MNAMSSSLLTVVLLRHAGDYATPVLQLSLSGEEIMIP